MRDILTLKKILSSLTTEEKDTKSGKQEKKEETEKEEQILKHHFEEFETFGDSVLKNIKTTGIKFCSDVRNQKEYILTLSGPTEVGKSTCLRCIDNFIGYNKFIRFGYRKTDSKKTLYYEWKTIVDAMIDKKSSKDFRYKIRGCGLLSVEDFLSSKMTEETADGMRRKTNSFQDIEVEIAFDILNMRVGMATLIETNKTEEEIFTIDERVHSRLLRDGGIFLSIPKNTPAFRTRKKIDNIV